MTDLEARVEKLETAKPAASSAPAPGDDALMRRVKAFLDKYASQDPVPPAAPKSPAPLPQATHPGPSSITPVQHESPAAPLSHSPD